MLADPFSLAMQREGQREGGECTGNVKLLKFKLNVGPPSLFVDLRTFSSENHYGALI